MHKLTQAFLKLRPTALALVALGGACGTGFAGASLTENYKELPARVVQNEENIASLQGMVDEIKELLQESNCLAIAEQDESLHWRECINIKGEG